MTLVQANTELQILIRQELNEDLNTRDSYVKDIKEWLLQQPHLPDTWDEVGILNFLRGCSFSLEKCKKKLDAYFTIRTAIPEIYSNRTFKYPELLKVSKLVNQTPLPTLTNKGCRVNILRYKYKNQYYNVDESIKLHLMLYDLRLLLEETGITGDVLIIDGENLTSHQFFQITPAAVKKYFISIFDVYPVKVKEAHVINIHPLVNTLISWIQPFLKKKIRDRLHFHRDGMESLYKFVPKEILPEEYGGYAGKLQEMQDVWLQKLEEYEDWFVEQENFKSDESKRPGKPINSSELFGVEGSFKQLTID